MPSPRVKVLVPMSRAQRARLRHKAKTTGLSIAELLRRGGEQYTRTADLAAFDHVARDVIRTTDKAIQSIETTLALVAQSEARIRALRPSRSAHDVGR